jgi:tetratricopeptide (TPR) repeat protein
MNAVIDLQPGAQPADIRRDLVNTIGEMAALIGALTTLDRRDFGTGESYLVMGLTAARKSENDDLLAFVLGIRAFHAAYGGNLRQGLDYAEGGVSYARGRASCTTRGWLAAVASELYATDRDDYRCRSYLDQAEIALMSAEAEDEHPWVGLGIFDIAKLRAYRGGNLARLGQHRAAQAELTAALAALPTSALKHRATACIDLAEAHLALREIDDACTWAEEALGLTERTHHADSLRRIHLIYRRARAVAGRSAAVRSLGEHLLFADR